ncbi:hypothetical protein, partial [Burkholderia pseudomallei]
MLRLLHVVVFLVVDLSFESLNDTDRKTNRKPINSAMDMITRPRGRHARRLRLLACASQAAGHREEDEARTAMRTLSMPSTPPASRAPT